LQNSRHQQAHPLRPPVFQIESLGLLNLIELEGVGGPFDGSSLACLLQFRRATLSSVKNRKVCKSVVDP
jgi:hypothetical protein